jgi:hypothetical protein
MSNVEMPRFNFSKSSIKTDEELQAAAEASNKGSKFFQPGKYEVVIDAVEYKGPAKGDPTWGNLEVTYKGAGEKTIRDYILVPFQDVKYGDKGTLFPFRKVQNFGESLGTTVTMANLEAAMKALFANPEKLKGRPVSIEVGYRKGHVKYLGKHDDGTKRYGIVDRDGNSVRDADMKSVEFPDFEAALGYAEDQKIPVDKFVNVLSYEKSSVAAPKASTGW